MKFALRGTPGLTVLRNQSDSVSADLHLDVIGDIEDGSKVAGQYCAIYLTPALSEGSLVMVSNIWGHYHSRIVHDSELISFWASQHEDLHEP